MNGKVSDNKSSIINIPEIVDRYIAIL